ncbi:YhgE/Pip family protein [Metabacillus sp. KIGAM252]|uniref:YhgE/Pip family protein n=1 Tax=Metabacillus flavus TaxID=2823519 RepID=A0ABS5LA37_9BACI|nr:YhgE/Pip family protein [Metabacillus flavus]MBS2967585.1 YhgE/Pip family protein [Metabacillus flavus]
MNTLKRFFTQRMFWGGLAGLAAAALIFTFAFLGSVVNPAPKDLPVALVVQDEGVQLPTGQKLEIGKQLEDKLTSNKDLPFKWTVLKDEKTAKDGLNDRTYYAALILPADLSQKAASIQSPKPMQAEAKLILNQGKNLNAANSIGSIMDKVFTGVNGQIREQMLAPIKAQGKMISPEQASLLANPIQLKSETVNKVGENNGGGNSPAMMTQILWLTTIISSIIIFLTMKKASENRITPGFITGQLIAGLIFTAMNSLIILSIATGILGLDVPDFAAAYGFMVFTAFMFFLMQGALLNWIGFGAMPILILLFFFSSPVLSLAPEFLPEATRTWLLSWIPFTHSVEGFRSLFFFGGNGFEEQRWILGMIGLGAFAVMAVSIVKGLKKQPVSQTEAAAEN